MLQKLFGVPYWHFKAKDTFDQQAFIDEAHTIQATDKKGL